MTQRIRGGRVVSVFTRLSRAVCPSGCRWRIIQTPGSRHYWLVALVCLVHLVQPNKRNKLNKPDELDPRNAWPRKDEEGVARCPPCSQNAHDETVLVRCAQ